MKFNSLLNECMKSKFWPNQSVIRSLFLDVNFSECDLDKLKTHLLTELPQTAQKNIFLTLVESKIDMYKRLSSLTNSIYLFVGASYVGLITSDTLLSTFKIPVFVFILALIILAIFSIATFHDNKITKLNLIKYLLHTIETPTTISTTTPEEH